MKKKYVIIIGGLMTVAALCIVFFIQKQERNYNNVLQDTQATQVNSSTPVSNVKFTSVELLPWVVYWSTKDAIAELNGLKDNIYAISNFSAVFDMENHAYIQPGTTELFEKIKKEDFGKHTQYLTIVNDVINKDKTSLLKNKAVLEYLFSTKARRTSHINELIDLAVKGGYDGLEIDYEAFHSNQKILKGFETFCNELWRVSRLKNLELRIVLEPSFPVDKVSLPTGPEYVVMVYNLYGYGTNPGPKANKAFIQEVVEKTKNLPSPKTYAFATGGFDWGDDGNTKSLTEKQLKEKIPLGTVPTRDANSKCLTFNYSEDGVQHTVWVADGETLKFWIETAIEAGAESRFSIWRAGGNELGSIGILGGM